MKIEEIRKRITNSDLQVISLGLNFIKEKSEKERSRSIAAEQRATTMLALSGVLAGLLTNFGKNLLSLSFEKDLLLIAIFISSVLFIIKAAMYSIYALSCLKSYEVSHEFIYDVQEFSELEFLREELIFRTWEFYYQISLSSRRLFWTYRSQINVVASIIFSGLLSIFWLLNTAYNYDISSAISIIAALFVALSVIFLDLVVDKIKKVWSFKKDKPSQAKSSE